MEVAIASGKGGTGKTTVALRRPSIEGSTPVEVMVPKIDPDRCVGCGACARFCRFHALACVKDGVLLFPELCHGCGGCSLVCPESAIAEVPRTVGVVERGRSGSLGFIQGRLMIGEASATPVVRAIKRGLPNDGIVVLDAPPGTSCPVLETLTGVDHLILITEPTPFGLNDLALAVEAARALELPTSVIVNRSDVGDGRVVEYCAREGLDIWLEIPNDRAVAEAYARGVLPAEAVDGYRDGVARVAERLLRARSESVAG